VRRNTLFFAVVLLALALVAWAGWVNFKARSKGCRLAAGQQSAMAVQGKPAPPFTLEDLSGKKVSLADYKGKAVMINFWATWCTPCAIETPWLVELRNQYAAQGFEVLGISADDLDRGDPARLDAEKQGIARFVRKMQIPYPVLIDGDSISQPYGGLDVLPTSFFVDRNGNLVAEQDGVTSKEEIEGKIKKALGE
jgi:cytochrome c biogenesis protein CcmG/thiol:disulfide interchange protein DsbE